VTVRAEVRPVWPFRLRLPSLDGLFRRRGDAVQRLLNVDGEHVFTGVIATGDRVVFAARAASHETAAEGLRRVRLATGVDEDHREFHERFASDPFIGRAVRSLPELRVRRRPDPWETLAFAICEQLIEFDRAVVIQRRLIARFGHRCPETGLRDAPSAAAIAALAPAELCAFDLPAHRAATLRRAAIEVARGRVDLFAPDHERGWRRLRAISGIGPWTTEMLALQGQGRYDQVPAGDLGFIKLVGFVLTGNPRARAEVEDVRGFFERYGEWKGLAGEYLRVASGRGWLRPAASASFAPCASRLPSPSPSPC
jgi:3-methyladenine DNA glycosylase/8-oxoguanine DNA glycosylase